MASIAENFDGNAFEYKRRTNNFVSFQEFHLFDSEQKIQQCFFIDFIIFRSICNIQEKLLIQ